MSQNYHLRDRNIRIGEAMIAYRPARTNDDYFDLFCRAIEQRDEEAWADIAAGYRGQLAAWAVQAGVRLLKDEQAADIADQALARAWSALTPERFKGFPCLGALLAYLRACVTATVIDYARAQATRARTEQRLEPEATTTPEQQVLEELERANLWRLISQIVLNEQERIVLRESLVSALPPRDIQARHPDQFADVMAVYRTKRNLLNRLQRNHDLRTLWQERIEA
jgi:hypothetical protein